MANKFPEDVRSFPVVTAVQAESLIRSQERFYLFIGQSSCPFCRIFSPKLRTVAGRTHKPIHFLNSGDFSAQKAVDEFLERYQMPTVPALLVSQNGKVRTVCNSALSEDEIEAFLNS